MNSQLAFFAGTTVTLVTIGIETLERTQTFLDAYAQLGGLFCPAYTTGPPVLGLLLGLNVVLLMLFRWPKNEFFWWLHLVGILSLLMTLPFDFSPDHSLLFLSAGFGLAYRRELNLTDVWDWKGCVAAIMAGIASFGLLIYVLDMR